MAINFTKVKTDLTTINVGETKREDHTECKAGKDSRQRLYLTRPEDSPSVILGYCHNCQDSGVHILHKDETFRKTTVNPKSVSKSTIVEPEAFKIPTSIEFDPKKWGADAVRYRITRNLTPQDCKNLGLGWDYSKNAIYTPTYETMYFSRERDCVKREGQIGYSLRYLNEGACPRYTHYKVNKTVKIGTVLRRDIFLKYPDRHADTTILVEDIISGYRVMQAANLIYSYAEVLVNYGTNVNLELLAKATGNKNIVWLDNDNKHVLSQADHNAKILSMLTGMPTRTIKLSGDPKYLTVADLKDFL